MLFQHTLGNGLRIIGEKIPYLHSVTVGVWAGAGSVKENERQAGITHFIEHMLFKGTARRSAHDIAKEMDSLGANINAFTAKECTCYYTVALAENLPECMDVLGDIVLHSSLEPAEMEKEKGVICEEILMIEDNPEEVVYELMAQTCYATHPLGKPIIGTKESVLSFSREDLACYMDEQYVAGNLLLAVVGNFDEQEFVELAEKHFGDVRPGAAPAFPEAPAPLAKKLTLRNKDIEQAHLCLALPGFSPMDEEFFSLYVLANAFGGNMSSRLFQKIREELGLAYTVYCTTSTARNCGNLSIYAGTGNAQCRTVLKVILDELDKLKAHGLSVEELARSKSQLKGSFVLGRESASARMHAMGKSLLLNGRIRGEDEVLEKIGAVTLEMTENVARQIINPAQLCVAVVGNGLDASALEIW